MPSNTVAADHIDRADSVWQKGVGLIGRGALATGHGLWLPDVGSVHTFGLLGAIDVLFLDRALCTALAVRYLEPGRICIGPASSRHCIELGAGTLGEKQWLSAGAQWSIEPVA